jgi:mono/diheme cytochrome c family protein
MTSRIGTTGAVLVCLLTGFAFRAEQPSPAEQAKFFETQVQPILQANCLSCHGAEKKIKGGLNLMTRDGLLKGGKTGPAVTLEKPDDSLLLQAVRHEDLKMPPKGKLTKAQIDVLAQWVKMGVPWSEKPIAKRHGPPPVDDQARQFWSFRPIVRPPIPAVKNTDWSRNPIDAFVLSKLEQANLAPAPPADKAALLRRLSYDLTGLPPTPEVVTAFVNDAAPDAYEKAVDRLLASPAYGEHWARHWLDLVRYAETNSFERDGAKPNVWRYRDYVIRSLNADKPYDQFIKEQLAGDELDEVTPDAIIATGYYRLGIWDDEPVDRTQAYYDELDDILSTTAQTFLGLTVGCARCHDHKIDPFPQKDYYSLLAFFHGIRHYEPNSQRSIASAEVQKQEQEAVVEWKKKVDDVNAKLKAIEDELRPHLEGGERDDFKFEENRVTIVGKHVPQHVTAATYERYQIFRRQREFLHHKPPVAQETALCVLEDGPQARDSFVLLRGNPHNKGNKVAPAFPSVLPTVVPVLPVRKPEAKTSGRRRVLAEWLTRKDNPLTARVMVNRLWQYHFGRGLVRSSSNFGYQGTPPTHPELLDWLASEFVERGWKLKSMHKLMVMSNAYRMSSRPEPSALARDPENDLLWRFDPRRLTAEEVRDSILAVCGNLNRKMGGPSIHPTIAKEVLAGQSMPGNGWDLKCPPEERARRTVYVHIKRSLAVPILNAFDAADPDGTCPVRFVTTQPGQALGMLNSEFLNEQAKLFADDVHKKAGEDVTEQVRLALRRVTQREPAERELARGVAFIGKMQSKHQRQPDEALRTFCLLALNLNEFIYLD